MPEPGSKSSPRPPQKARRGTQTDVTPVSVTTSPERVDDDYYYYYRNFVEDEALAYGRENVGPVASPYLMPYI